MECIRSYTGWWFQSLWKMMEFRQLGWWFHSQLFLESHKIYARNHQAVWVWLLTTQKAGWYSQYHPPQPGSWCEWCFFRPPSDSGWKLPWPKFCCIQACQDVFSGAMAKNIGFSHGFKPQEHDDFSFFCFFLCFVAFMFCWTASMMIYWDMIRFSNHFL